MSGSRILIGLVRVGLGAVALKAAMEMAIRKFDKVAKDKKSGLLSISAVLRTRTKQETKSKV